MRALILIAFSLVASCAILDEELDEDIGLTATAECGKCDTCRVQIKGAGTTKNQTTNVNIEERPK